MHEYSMQTQELAEQILAYSQKRLRMDPAPLDHPHTHDELEQIAGGAITAQGRGGLEALDLFTRELAPACLSTDHPRYLSFIPCAPTREAAMFDLVVGASSIYSGSWLEGSGAVFAENQALSWIAGLVGLPESAGGSFVQGGTIGNLSALVTARAAARERAPEGVRPWRIAATEGAHSSIATAARVMDAELVGVALDENHQLTGQALRETLLKHGPETFFGVVATAGSTNFGVIDHLDSIADVCAEFGVWFHVDGAYGGAGLAAPSVRHKYRGVERCDSFIVDPHKWLFSPFDCCALLYRDPALARMAHTQHATYLDVLTDTAEWNPTDYSIGLTRRARGLPFWFSLVANGTDAYTAAIERTLEVTRYAEAEVRRRPELEVVRSADLSVLVFRRVGWTAQEYHAWSDHLLDEQIGFVVPTSHDGETLARFAIVNPKTSEEDIRIILDTMSAARRSTPLSQSPHTSQGEHQE
ncbi:pyridoxal phosphate-dependent decarboxylase family protein [Dermacoccaceae bacterium W4C1]